MRKTTSRIFTSRKIKDRYKTTIYPLPIGERLFGLKFEFGLRQEP
jgi:hypothetical protein